MRPVLTSYFGKRKRLSECILYSDGLLENNYAFGMGLCPIAPPKGFPLALWKPSDLLLFLLISFI